MVATVKPFLFWLAGTAWDPLTTIGAALMAATAPLVLVSKQVLSGERGTIRRPSLKVVDARTALASCKTIEICAAPAATGQHWQRLTAVIAANIGGARAAADYQAAASVQLDAAEFTLSQIMKDLAEVMPSLSRAEAMRPAVVLIGGRRLAA
ncbi:MAG: hypothetical protein ACKVP3_23885 [Hyphomicrobiaceae bacterium]